RLVIRASLATGREPGLCLWTGRVGSAAGSARWPVIGWCRTTQTEPSPLWAGVADHSYFYYVHSFTPEGSGHRIGCSDHSPAAAAQKGNILGTQFHPEKSGPDGLRIYANFIGLCA